MKMLIDHDTLATLRSGKAPVPFECAHCGRTFYVPKYRVLTALKGNSRNKLDACGQECAHALLKLSQMVTCLQCGKTFEKQASQIRKAPNHFCSNSCSAIYNNQRKKRGDVRRSYAETYLSGLIRADFPDLAIQENVRDLLPGGYEIDILIPSLRLAIELNGPIHYFPIHGEAQLHKIQNADIQKQIELQALGYNLLVVDIARIKHHARTRTFLDAFYPTHIKPLLQSG